MYEKFYGLDEKPFNATPDPRFLFLGEHHQEALAHLIYGVNERKGFIVLTGEVGSGKTTLIRTLFERLGDNVKTALIFNPNLTLKDLFLTILDEFGLEKSFRTKTDFLTILNDFLIERLKANENAVIVIDESQNLSPSLLEEIRLLLNMETSKHKLLQVILSGQPELNQKLELPELRQLKQRISIRYHIPPLTRAETEHYIRERIGIAGAKDSLIFSDKAINKIFNYAGGIPRLINILCDNSLLTGYATNKPNIGPAIVRECIEDLKTKNTKRDTRAYISGLVLKGPFKKTVWRQAFILLFLCFAIVGYLWWNTELITHDLRIWFEGKRGTSGIQIAQDMSGKIRKEIDSTEATGLPAGGQTSVPSFAVEDRPTGERDISGTSGEETVVDQVFTVRDNDKLSTIAARRYGFANEEILDFIKTANPEIKDVDYIEVGQRINLPDLDKEAGAGKIEK